MLERARCAESFGYSRYWLTEHQGYADAWGSPEIALAWLASRTTRLRVGTAGLLVSTHIPLRVASDFSLLSSLFHDRIDLGLARGLPALEGNRQEACRALAATLGTFEERLETIERLYDLTSERSISTDVHALPFPPVPPQIWLLGSGNYSLEIAARRGHRYCHSLFHSTESDLSSVRSYFKSFKPSMWNDEPAFAVSFGAICAETAEMAADLANRFTLEFPIINFVGNPHEFLAYIESLYESCGATDFVIVDATSTQEQALASLRLMAEAINLCPRFSRSV